MNVCVCGLCAPGEEDVPAAARPTVRLARGGVAAQRETKGGATTLTGPAAKTGGNTITCTHTHTHSDTHTIIFV